MYWKYAVPNTVLWSWKGLVPLLVGVGGDLKRPSAHVEDAFTIVVRDSKALFVLRIPAAPLEACCPVSDTLLTCLEPAFLHGDFDVGVETRVCAVLDLFRSRGHEFTLESDNDGDLKSSLDLP